ncbi:MAG: 23S rRNA (pseudouridine(1915)-N(3))-methyltransferase RlmH [Thermaerobacterales bacterium]
MKIQIISVGKIGAAYLREGAEHYLRRLRPYAQVEWRQVDDEPAPARLSVGERKQILEREGARILDAVWPDSHVIALTRSGRPLNSEELAGYLNDLAIASDSRVTVIIGGTLGLSPAVLKRVHLPLSLSRMTFPHQMVPMILTEQLYRAFRILRGEPYHAPSR